MLVLKRSCMESIKINSDITLTLGTIQQKTILLSIEMPSHVVLTTKKGCKSIMPASKTGISRILSARTASTFRFELTSDLENYPFTIIVNGNLYNAISVRFVFQAPQNVSIFRSEIYWKIMESMASGYRAGRKIQGITVEKPKDD